MSNLPGNPHAYNAEYAMNSTVLSSDDSGTQVIESLLMDNAKATLALAYEQRTANLLEFWKWHQTNPETPETAHQLYVEIVDRLGLGEGHG